MSSPINPREVIGQIQWQSVNEFCNNYLDYVGTHDEVNDLLQSPPLNELISLCVRFFDAVEVDADTSEIDAAVREAIAAIGSEVE